MDIVGTQAKLRIVRLGGHCDADLGAVGQRPTRPTVALIRGGDGQVVLPPEVLGWLVMQAAIDQAVQIAQ
ncbi:hypothetical protein D3C81_2309150 [compost metagenome]